MQIKVDKTVCVSAGRCAAHAPELFDQDENDGVVILLQDKPPPHLHKKAEEAAEFCPARAILIQKAGG